MRITGAKRGETSMRTIVTPVRSTKNMKWKNRNFRPASLVLVDMSGFQDCTTELCDCSPLSGPTRYTNNPPYHNKKNGGAGFHLDPEESRRRLRELSKRQKRGASKRRQ